MGCLLEACVALICPGDLSQINSHVKVRPPGLGGGVAPQGPIKGGSTPLQVLDAFFPLFFSRAIAEQYKGIDCDIPTMNGSSCKGFVA